MSKHFDLNWAQSRNDSVWTTHETNYGKWHTGEIRTRHGIATAYIDERCTSVDFIWDGRWHRRTWDRAHPPKGVTIMAGRFVKEVVANAERKSK